MSRAVRIVKTPEVLHGKPRIEGTRIGVLQVGELGRRDDWSVERLTREFDLDSAQVEAALEYYEDHPELMETLRAQREANVRAIRERGRADDDADSL
jgi:uncharacterized protein (DUF433 family)